MKKPKKEEKDLDEADLAFKAKQKEEQARLKELQTKAAKGGPMSTISANVIALTTFALLFRWWWDQKVWQTVTARK